MNTSVAGEGLWQIINLILLLLILGGAIYLVFLIIKALKVYIKKNS